MKRYGSPPRCEQLVRTLSVLRLLEGRGRHTLEDIAQRFSVSTRTIRRDLEALERVGYPLGHEARGDGWDGLWWLV